MKNPDIKYTKLPDCVLDRLPQLDSDEVRVIIAIATCAERSFDHQWYVSRDAIERQSGLSTERCVDALRQLTEAQVLNVEEPCDRLVWQLNLDTLTTSEEVAA